MDPAAFEKTEELSKELMTVVSGSTTRLQRRIPPDPAPPAPTTTNQDETLPGNPQIKLTGPTISQFLKEEMTTRRLNSMAPYFWLLTTMRSNNISSLTEQVVRGRTITVTENPGLHLVWIRDRVFVKPLPKFLLSHAFWEYYLLSDGSPIEKNLRQEVLSTAKGFLRSYNYLIKHESDFRLATEVKTCLIPDGISYDDFAKFASHCQSRKQLADEFVSPRYQVGEIRLTRLNFWSTVLLRSSYQTIEWQYGEYFAQFYAPILFVFGMFSLLLSSMSLVMSVGTALEPKNVWLSFANAARGFALFTVFLVTCVILFFLLAPTVLLGKEAFYAVKHRSISKKNIAEGQINGNGSGIEV